LIFERVWLDDGRIVAVRPKETFAPFFSAARQNRRKSGVSKRERRDSNSRPPA
jgi:hypothetical protein